MTVDEPIEETDVRDLLKDVLVRENMQNAQIEIQHSSKVGDGFLGVTNAIEVRNDGNILKLFVKSAPKNKKLRQVLYSRAVFLKEIYFYDRILPTCDDFLHKRTGQSLDLTSKCYATNSEEGKEALVFDNLREEAFQLFDKKQLLNEEHVLLVLRSYAKFHGVSYALKDQQPDLYQSLSGKVSEQMVALLKNFDYGDILKNCAIMLREHLEGKICTTHLDKLDKITGELYDFIEEAAVVENDYKIITHGDCWMNNMMFKYEEGSTEPIGIKLLDFQMNRVSLPVFDLSYFFYCSACTEENLAKLDYYLEYYHDNLLAFIRRLGSDADKIYPYDIFREHWRKFSRFGLLMSIGVTKMTQSEGEETPNIAKMVSEGDNHEGAFNINLSSVDIYVERMERVLLHFINNKFI